MNQKIDMSNVVIRTKRLILRPWKQEDLNDFYEYAKVEGVGQMAGWLPHRNVEESKKILEQFIQEKKTLALEFQGKVIGSLGIEKYNEKNFPELEDLKGREIGYVLSKEYWGNGLMPEAVQAVIKYLFSTVGLDFILVGHFKHNDQSRRVIEKCGFQYLKTVNHETYYHTIEITAQYIKYHLKFGKERIKC